MSLHRRVKRAQQPRIADIRRQRFVRPGFSTFAAVPNSRSTYSFSLAAVPPAAGRWHTVRRIPPVQRPVAVPQHAPCRASLAHLRYVSARLFRFEPVASQVVVQRVCLEVPIDVVRVHGNRRPGSTAGFRERERSSVLRIDHESLVERTEQRLARLRAQRCGSRTESVQRYLSSLSPPRPRISCRSFPSAQRPLLRALRTASWLPRPARAGRPASRRRSRRRRGRDSSARVRACRRESASCSEPSPRVRRW